MRRRETLLSVITASALLALGRTRRGNVAEAGLPVVSGEKFPAEGVVPEQLSGIAHCNVVGHCVRVCARKDHLNSGLGTRSHQAPVMLIWAKRGMWVIHLAVSLAALYAAIIAGMYFAQTWLLFPTLLARATRVRLPESTQRLKVRTADGESLMGVRIPCVGGTVEGAPSLLGFGGNAWNAETMALMLHRLFPDRSVIGFHYRGYTPSSGRPSAEALLSDSLVIFDHLRQTQSNEPIIAVGFSIGSSVAAYVAWHRPVEGLILVTPFDSLEALARDLYWWAPVGLLFRHGMSTIEFVRDSLVPTALLIAEHDAVVPARRSTSLRAAIGNLVLERVIHAGHNDIYDRPGFAAAMQEALARIEAV